MIWMNCFGEYALRWYDTKWNISVCERAFVWFAAVQDHEVREDQIVLVSLLMAELGVHSVAYAFPKVKIITTAVDKSLDDLLHVVPGIGEWRRCWQEVEEQAVGTRVRCTRWVGFIWWASDSKWIVGSGRAERLRIGVTNSSG